MFLEVGSKLNCSAMGNEDGAPRLIATRQVGAFENQACTVRDSAARAAILRKLTRYSHMMKKHVAALFCLVLSGFVPALAQQPTYPFNDPLLPMEKRIDNLLSLTKKWLAWVRRQAFRGWA